MMRARLIGAAFGALVGLATAAIAWLSFGR